MTVLKQIWTAILTFFGIRQEERDQAVMDGYRKRITKEKIAELGSVIDGQVDVLTALEEKWQATYESVEEYIKKRDERDQAFLTALNDISDDCGELMRLHDADDDAAGKRRREMLIALYEESRFYVGMADNLKEMLEAHRERIEAGLSAARSVQASFGAISAATLSAAMLSARFGEDAQEFAQVCDKIREQAVAGAGELTALEERLDAEIGAFEETFVQLSNLTGQLFQNRDTITVLYDAVREQGDDAGLKTSRLCGEMDEKIEDMRGQLYEAGGLNRAIEEETRRFRTVDEEETKSREQIEEVAEEIHQMITEA